MYGNYMSSNWKIRPKETHCNLRNKIFKAEALLF